VRRGFIPITITLESKTSGSAVPRTESPRATKTPRRYSGGESFWALARADADACERQRGRAARTRTRRINRILPLLASRVRSRSVRVLRLVPGRGSIFLNHSDTISRSATGFYERESGRCRKSGGPVVSLKTGSKRGCRGPGGICDCIVQPRGALDGSDEGEKVGVRACGTTTGKILILCHVGWSWDGADIGLL
jgi:hypothetical protein